MYLNGVRGWAAVLVYWHHHEIWAHNSAINIFERAYGYRGLYHIIALPWIRLLFNGGHFATAVFFVISGYLVSRRPLELIERRQKEQLATHLSSAIFRRWIRLYLPLMATTFIYMTSWHVFDLRIRWVRPQQSYFHEIKAWFAEVMDYSFPFSRVGSLWLSYNDHLWSIPAEFKGSMVNYMILLAVSQSSRKARLIWQGSLVCFFMYAIRDGWYLSFFLAGMLVQEMEQWIDTSHAPLFLDSGSSCYPFAILLFSMYLGGVPHCSSAACIKDNTGWSVLSFLVPTMDLAYDPKWHFLLPAAVLFVVSIKRISWLICFFESPLSQYLGSISYSLYLVHGPVMRVFADTLYAVVGWSERGPLAHPFLDSWKDFLPLPSWGPLGMELAFIAPQVLLGPLTICIANFVSWAVDKPAMRFSQWLFALATFPSSNMEVSKSR